MTQATRIRTYSAMLFLAILLLAAPSSIAGAEIPKVILVSHRGYTASAPENTLEGLHLHQ